MEEVKRNQYQAALAICGVWCGSRYILKIEKIFNSKTTPAQKINYQLQSFVQWKQTPTPTNTNTHTYTQMHAQTHKNAYTNAHTNAR